jgi:hypothetical protein
MGTRRIRLLTNLRRRLGFHVGRTWLRPQRLRLELQPLRPGSRYLFGDGQITDHDSDELVYVLGPSSGTERGDGPDHRPRSFDGVSSRLGYWGWTMESECGSSYTVTFDSAARYSDYE